SCEPIPGNSSRALCMAETTIEPTPESVELVTPDPSNGEADWAVSIMMDNSGSLVGEGVSEDDSSVVLARATDRGGFRISSMQQFVNLLNDTESRPWGENMALGLWSFRGETSAGVQPETGELATGNTPANPYTFNRQVITQALTELRRQAEFGRSNVFTALQVVAENFRDLPGTANRERAIILFTDGPDDSEVVFIEASDEDRQRAKDARQQKLEDAISILQEQQIQVFVVHLDTAIGPEGVAAVQADPFNAQPYPRDGDGRFGPLDEYARIACATNGQYVYVPNPERLNRVMELLVDQFGGTWGVNVGIESLEQTQLENAPYQLGTIMQVTLGDEGRYFFSPLGNTSSAIGSSDNRPAVFKRQGGAPRENTNLGGTLNNTTINLPSGTP
ncbi:MAG: vWA domain-containing protein, partial [Myxococcota bacterium]